MLFTIRFVEGFEVRLPLFAFLRFHVRVLLAELRGEG
jgi:hypothetical protein